MADPPGPGSGRRRVSVMKAIAQFSAAGLIALLVIGIAGTIVLQRFGTDQAIRDAREHSRLVAHGVVEPHLDRGILTGDPSALARLDRVVRERVLTSRLIRVKIWTTDGLIIYSDEPRLVGSRYELGADELLAVQEGRVDAELSDLGRPENRFERSEGKLLEVYMPLTAPDGSRLLFEAYLRFDSITAGGRRIWMDFALVFVIGLLLIEALQVPLAWSLARRLRQGQEEREKLLRRAIEASDAERRRIASDLHDGVVQDLMGISMNLTASAPSMGNGSGNPERALTEAARDIRQSVRGLRTLLLEIYPPNLHAVGLRAAFSDLATPLTSRGIDVTLDIADDFDTSTEFEKIMFRSGQEALRNVLAHADASEVLVRLTRHNGRAKLTIHDDGRGFLGAKVAIAQDQGHFGLRMLEDLAAGAGGTFHIRSKPGEGTSVEVEVPV